MEKKGAKVGAAEEISFRHLDHGKSGMKTESIRLWIVHQHSNQSSAPTVLASNVAEIEPTHLHQRQNDLGPHSLDNSVVVEETVA